LPAYIFIKLGALINEKQVCQKLQKDIGFRLIGEGSNDEFVSMLSLVVADFYVERVFH
jgi:hypothetical protein